MSRATALDIVKFIATRRLVTVRQISEFAHTEESNTREWLYEMQKLGMACPCGNVERTIQANKSSRGKRLVQQWKWLL